MQKTIAIDLDGVLAQYTEWEGIDKIGDPIPGAVKMCEELIQQGHKVYIYTTRLSRDVNPNHSQKELYHFVRGWLKKHNFPKKLGVWLGDGKPLFDIMIDDRAFYHVPNSKWTSREMDRLRSRIKK